MQSHPLKHPAFAIHCVIRFLTSTALMIQSVTIGWQVYSVARQSLTIEQSSFLVGMVGLAQFVPLFLLALIAGAAADRYDRRHIVLICGILQAASAVAFALISASGNPALPVIFLLAGLFGVARAFANPAVSALAPALVPVALLPRAVPWNILSGQSGMILGPAAGGILAGFGPAIAYGAAALLYCVAAVLVLVLMTMKLNARGNHMGASRFGMIREGLAYLGATPIVLGAISLDLFAVFLGGVTALLPVVARDILHVGADGFGVLRAGAAIGAGAMTVLLSFAPIRRHAGPFMLGAVLVYGLATIAFAFSHDVLLSFALLVILGAADSISVFVRQSLVQIVTPHDMRGRVAAVSTLFIGASNELGEFESGVAARLLGPFGSILFGGIGSVVVVLAWSRLFPALARADRLEATPDSRSAGK